jgi:hypothetical protein
MTEPIYALTIWQPWASLVMLGAKPYEFRKWDYRARAKHLVGKRIVVHAGARQMYANEVGDIITRIRRGESGLNPEIALPLLARVMDAHKGRGVLELRAGLGMVTLGAPRPVTENSGVVDSDRLDHAMWGWPMENPELFEAPIPRTGAQGFWRWT